MTAHRKKRPSTRGRVPVEVDLDALIEEATVDAYDMEEQRTGFQTLLEENLRLPFEAEVLGVAVTVERLDVNDEGAIVAVCRRGSARQAIPVVDLALPDPAPHGAEWIEAYRRWARRV